MFIKYKIYLKSLLFLILLTLNAYSEIVKEISITGNERISNETVLVFSPVKINDNIDENKLNFILKEIYNSGFFEDVQVTLIENRLNISLKEYPLIEKLTLNGVKSSKIRDEIFKTMKLKSRSSYNEVLIKNDKEQIISLLKKFGYYFAKLDIKKNILENNKVDIIYDIVLNEKAKIKNITFLGNKVFKDRLLKNIIISEEYKFWKFLSQKKFLNEDLVIFDTRLLKNYYLNKGYYNVNINSSFAKIHNDNNFELVFNIDAGPKVYFNNVSLDIPIEYNADNFTDIQNLFMNISGTEYSVKTIEKILNEIDKISIQEEFALIEATAKEKLTENKIDLLIEIKQTEPIVVEKINFIGNNITKENVLRNQLIIDEGDYFNELLFKKSINNLKNLNFFKTVEPKIIENNETKSKIIDVFIEEKPTGEIAASAGAGTNGGIVGFSLKENNYLGKGIGLNSFIELSSETLKGGLSVSNPNLNNSDKSARFSFQTFETDKLKNFGYKTNNTSLSADTSFEYLDDLFLGLGFTNSYEVIETDNTASILQQSQKGNYYDLTFDTNFDYDKRNQKFQTTDGFRSIYSINIPLLSETSTLKNTYNYKYFAELFENNVSTASIYFSAANSLNNSNIKLTERQYIPSSKLRGFEQGKIGPVDGQDYVGGNYAAAINFTTTIPQILSNSQNTDIVLFFDAANLWGVDYNSSIDNSEKIRSSVGVAIDWLTPIGPLNFSLSQPITKNSTDVTETFRFNLGTTF